MPPDSSDGTHPIVRFYRMIPAARPPQRADRSALGTLPTRAFRYCDAITQACGFGWHVYPPMDFQLLFDGEEVFWTYDEAEGWLPLSAAQFPNMVHTFDNVAPKHLRGCSPPFLTALTEPGTVQIWTGLIARAAAGWSLLVRSPANLWVGGGYSQYEGILESDRWFGPLFTNIRLTRTDTPVRIRAELPLVQIQPLPRTLLVERLLERSEFVDGLSAFADTDWQDYERTVVQPNDDQERQNGAYAVAARKRRRGECPMATG